MTNVPSAEGLNELIDALAALGVTAVGPLVVAVVLAAAVTRWRATPFPLTASLSILIVGLLTPIVTTGLLYGLVQDSSLAPIFLQGGNPAL